MQGQPKVDLEGEGEEKENFFPSARHFFVEKLHCLHFLDEIKFKKWAVQAVFPHSSHPLFKDCP